MGNESKEGEKPDWVGVQLCRWRNGMVAWALHESFLISSNPKIGGWITLGAFVGLWRILLAKTRDYAFY